MCSKDLFNASAYSLAKVPNSPIGEYFFKMISPFRSVNISKGSPSRIRSVRRISFGTTTLPNSSILRTMPVAFICFPPAWCKLLPLMAIFSANCQFFISDFPHLHKHFFPIPSPALFRSLHPVCFLSKISRVTHAACMPSRSNNYESFFLTKRQ